jgi:hypothetical protein
MESTPGSSRRRQPPFLRGNRRSTFKEIYESHYSHQSEQAHQRAAAVGVALLVDNPEDQWNPGHGESHILSSAILFLTCILSEIEAKGRYQGHPRLRELWAYLRDLDDEAKDLWGLRWYVSQCLEIDVASQGETEEEALANLKEALELHFEPPQATRPPAVRMIEVEVGAT